MRTKRRPLLGVALLGGTTYYVGTKVAQGRQHNDEGRP